MPRADWKGGKKHETYHLLAMVDPTPREDNGASALRHFP